MVKLVADRLQESSIEQYRREERSMIAKRIINSQARYKELVRCIINDKISTFENVKQLRMELHDFSGDMKFKRARNMGQILRTALEFVKRNYEDVSMKRILHENR